MTESRCERRARHLVALYPRSWRARFGEEFEQLLVDEMDAHGRSARHTADVVAHGLLARLVVAGVVAQDGPARVRAAMALRGLTGAASVFVVIGVGLWSQLTIGWQWAPPAAPTTRSAMLMMSGALLVLGVLAALALAVVAGAAIGGRSARPQGRWLLASVGCAAVFSIACRHVGAAWPGTGGHPWAEHALVPPAIARLAWAATLWMTAYWAHPHALGGFPALEVGWMVLSPLLTALIGVCVLRAGRGLVLPRAALRALVAIGAAAIIAAATFVAGVAEWQLGPDRGPHGLFESGRLDAVGLALLSLALLVAGQAVHRGLRAAIELGLG